MTRQLLLLLAHKRAFPGDVLYDIKGVVSQIVESRALAARCAQSALHHVATRYGLLRYRPRQPTDPQGTSRTLVCAVSEAALTMAPLVWRSLGAESV